MKVKSWREAVLCALYDIGGSNGGPVELQQIWMRFQLGRIRVREELHGETFGQPTYRHWVRSNLNGLKNSDLVENIGRGIWRLTTRGLAEASCLVERLRQEKGTDLF